MRNAEKSLNQSAILSGSSYRTFGEIFAWYGSANSRNTVLFSSLVKDM
jgi:hypothetical protein